MKVDWDFVQRIHRMLKELPDKKDEYKALYPEAFHETEITAGVTCKLVGNHSRWHLLKVSFFGKLVTEIRFTMKSSYQEKDDENKTGFRHWTTKTEPGFKVSWGGDGIRVFKYGPKRKSKDDDELPF